MDRVAQAKSLIDADLARHYSIDELAAMCGIAQAKLKKGFKYITGAGLYGYLRNARMEQAATLLTTTERSIKQISALCGFAYASNFRLAFIKHYGTSPGKYRDQHNKDMTVLDIP